MIIKTRKNENEEENEEDEDSPYTTKSENIFVIHFYKVMHFVLLNRTLRIFVVMGLMAILLPCLIYMFVYAKRIQTAERNQDVGTCVHNTDYHVPCGVVNMTQTACLNTFCCFSPVNGCYHSLPSRHLYKIKSGAWEPTKVLEPVVRRTPRGLLATTELRIALNEISDSKLSIFVWNPSNSNDPSTGPLTSAKKYDAKVYPRGVIEVKRTSSPFETILTTARGPLIVANNYFEWNIYLGSRFLYGLGDGQLNPGYRKTLINTESTNAIPFIMAYNNITNEFNGITFSASGPVEIQILPSSLIVIRAMQNTLFRVDLLVGPTPSDLIDQIHINRELIIPPIWLYGVHVCYFSTNFNSTLARENLRDLKTDAETKSFPFDSFCVHDKVMSLTNLNEILRSNILNGITELKKLNKRFMASVIPQISPDTAAYASAILSNILLRHRTLDIPYPGKINNKTASYIDWVGEPDKIKPWLTEYWPDNSQLPADGFLLQNNWMRDETIRVNNVPQQSFFPYVPTDLVDRLANLTPWNIRHSNSESPIIYVLNEMPLMHTDAIRNHIEKDTLLISSSFSVNHPSPVILQNFNATWLNLRQQALKIVASGMAGINVIGSSVCGDTVYEEDSNYNQITDINEELCIRWYQFGSLTPIFRVRSDRIPSKFSKYARQIMNNAIQRRYSLLSYYHTILSSGKPLLVPMFYYYENLGQNMTDLSEQFHLGDSILAAPVLFPDQVNKRIYFPEEYYNFDGGFLWPKGWHEFNVVELDLPLFIRSGFIVAKHDTNLIFSVDEARLQSIELVVALKCIISGENNLISCRADGEIMLTKDLIWKFSATKENIILELTKLDADGDTASIIDGLCKLETKVVSSVIRSVKVYGYPDQQKTNNGILVRELREFDICDETTIDKIFEEKTFPLLN